MRKDGRLFRVAKMEIKKIKLKRPGPRIREISTGGKITLTEWKRLLKKYSHYN